MERAIRPVPQVTADMSWLMLNEPLNVDLQNHVWEDVTRHNCSLPPLAVKNPERLGLLHKLDNSRDAWVQHYCILKDGCLSFYSRIRATHAQGMVTEKRTEKDKGEGNGRGWRSGLTGPDSQSMSHEVTQFEFIS